VDTNIPLQTPARKREVFSLALLRRYCFILTMGAWMGGFTFYALIVIPTAGKVLGGERDVGFITQQVTNWLNLIGVAALLILIWILMAEWRGLLSFPRLRLALTLAWVIMLVGQMGLFITHPFIDRLLQAEGHKVHHFDQFERMHTVYLTFATIQWSAAMLQIWLMLMAWRMQDQKSLGLS
jgi:hypothetical protein